MKIKRLLFIMAIVAGMISTTKTMAQAPWTVSPYDYHYDMSLYLSCEIGSGVMDYNGYYFGAFVGDECRGIAEALDLKDAEKPVYYMRIYSNVASGEAVSFKAFDSITEMTYLSEDSIVFENEAALGVPSVPYNVNFIVNATSVTLSQNTLALEIGESMALSATVAPTNASDKTVIWNSSDKDVATVNDGVVYAVGKGEATISATCGEVSATCEIAVTAPDPVSLTLNQTAATLIIGKTVELNAVISPVYAEYTLSWQSSNPEVATVSEAGLVTAISKGEATITVSTHNGLTDSCVVTVNAPEAENITLNQTSSNLIEGSTLALVATVTPDNAEYTLTWNSSDNKVATVSPEGLVKAVAPGTATITVVVSNGLTATCVITVEAKVIEATGIEISQSAATLKVNETLTLTTVVLPANTTDPTVVWSSSDNSIATVENGTVKGVAPGTATITAKCGYVSVICVVTVEKEPILPTSIVLSDSVLVLKEGETFQLSATVLPVDAEYTIRWSTAGETIATVDQEGLVTAITPGYTIITVSTDNGLKASCEVTVDESTSIDVITENGFNCSVYSLSGVLLKENADKDYIRGLEKGVYILKSETTSKVIVK